MDRARKITALCLTTLFLITLTVYAASKSYFTKVRYNGTIVNVQVTEGNYITTTQRAYLKDSKNKVLLSWKDHKPTKAYRAKDDKSKIYSYFPYNVNMYRYKPGKYKLVTHSFNRNIIVPFTYTGRTLLQYHSSKVVRNNNGDLVQRFYFKRNNAKGKMINAQIYNNKNQLVRAFKFKSGASNQLLSFNWNGWPGQNAANRCPRGVYTLKYWVDGASPKTAKFRLAI